MSRFPSVAINFFLILLPKNKECKNLRSSPHPEKSGHLAIRDSAQNQIIDFSPPDSRFDICPQKEGALFLRRLYPGRALKVSERLYPNTGVSSFVFLQPRLPLPLPTRFFDLPCPTPLLRPPSAPSGLRPMGRRTHPPTTGLRYTTGTRGSTPAGTCESNGDARSSVHLCRTSDGSSGAPANLRSGGTKASPEADSTVASRSATKRSAPLDWNRGQRAGRDPPAVALLRGALSLRCSSGFCL